MREPVHSSDSFCCGPLQISLNSIGEILNVVADEVFDRRGIGTADFAKEWLIGRDDSAAEGQCCQQCTTSCQATIWKQNPITGCCDVREVLIVKEPFNQMRPPDCPTRLTQLRGIVLGVD